MSAAPRSRGDAAVAAGDVQSAAIDVDSIEDDIDVDVGKKESQGNGSQGSGGSQGLYQSQPDVDDENDVLYIRPGEEAMTVVDTRDDAQFVIRYGSSLRLMSQVVDFFNSSFSETDPSVDWKEMESRSQQVRLAANCIHVLTRPFMHHSRTKQYPKQTKSTVLCPLYRKSPNSCSTASWKMMWASFARRVRHAK
jgi:hypothetical protein